MTNFEEAKQRVLAGSWTESALEPFSFVTSDPDAGWIDSTLELGSDTISIALSDVYPPFQDMLVWLERLISGEPFGALHIYDEIRDHYFCVTRTGEENHCVFEYVAPVWPAGGLYRSARVSFPAVVKEFYTALEKLMSVDFEGEAAKEEGTNVYFNLDPHSDDILRLDLSLVRAFAAREHI